MTTIGAWSEALRARKISSVELALETLSRVKASQTALNAFITIDDEGAIRSARAADAALARGDATPLTGIPIAHKDV
ncbi:MAG TPA: amidase family protein, partial [Casimicrobiaceae bacterium]